MSFVSQVPGILEVNYPTQRAAKYSLQPSFCAMAPRTGPQTISDPYEFYELRHPLDRASPVVQSHLVKQPGIASNQTPFQRIVIEDSLNPLAPKESTALTANYPKPFSMPTEDRLTDPLTDDESVLSFASCEVFDYKQREACGYWQSLLDLETIKVPVVSEDFLTEVMQQIPVQPRAARRKPKEAPVGSEQVGTFLRNGFRFGYAVLRQVHPSPLASTQPVARGLVSESRSSPDTLAPLLDDEGTTNPCGVGKRARNSPDPTGKKAEAGKGSDSSRLREKLGVSSESFRDCLSRNDSAHSSRKHVLSLRDLDAVDSDSLSTHASKDSLTVSELSSSASMFLKGIFSRAKRPTHRMARDVGAERWSAK